MADHLRSHHSNVVFLEAGENNTSTQKWLLKKRQHLAKATCYWNTVVWRIKDHQLAIRFFKREGIWYSFVVVFGDDSEAAGLSCEVGRNIHVVCHFWLRTMYGVGVHSRT